MLGLRTSRIVIDSSCSMSLSGLGIAGYASTAVVHFWLRLTFLQTMAAKEAAALGRQQASVGRRRFQMRDSISCDLSASLGVPTVCRELPIYGATESSVRRLFS